MQNKMIPKVHIAVLVPCYNEEVAISIVVGDFGHVRAAKLGKAA